jgi:hypothetical protein
MPPRGERQFGGQPLRQCQAVVSLPEALPREVTGLRRRRTSTCGAEVTVAPAARMVRIGSKVLEQASPSWQIAARNAPRRTASVPA